MESYVERFWREKAEVEKKAERKAARDEKKSVKEDEVNGRRDGKTKAQR